MEEKENRKIRKRERMLDMDAESWLCNRVESVMKWHIKRLKHSEIEQ